MLAEFDGVAGCGVGVAEGEFDGCRDPGIDCRRDDGAVGGWAPVEGLREGVGDKGALEMVDRLTCARIEDVAVSGRVVG